MFLACQDMKFCVAFSLRFARGCYHLPCPHTAATSFTVGAALGTGSAMAHRAVDSMMGPRSVQVSHEHQGAPPPAEAPSVPQVSTALVRIHWPYHKDCWHVSLRRCAKGWGCLCQPVLLHPFACCLTGCASLQRPRSPLGHLLAMTPVRLASRRLQTACRAATATWLPATTTLRRCRAARWHLLRLA